LSIEEGIIHHVKEELENKKCHFEKILLFFFVVIVGTCCVVGVVGLVAAAIFWYK
jgi:hypothetical protein